MEANEARIIPEDLRDYTICRTGRDLSLLQSQMRIQTLLTEVTLLL